MSIGIDFGIGIDQNSWYRTGIVSNPKKLVSPITNVLFCGYVYEVYKTFKVTRLLWDVFKYDLKYNKRMLNETLRRISVQCKMLRDGLLRSRFFFEIQTVKQSRSQSMPVRGLGSVPNPRTGILWERD